MWSFGSKRALFAFLLVAFNSIQVSLAGRRSHFGIDDTSSYTRLGRIPLSCNRNVNGWGLRKSHISDTEDLIPSTSLEEHRKAVRKVSLLKLKSKSTNTGESLSSSSELDIQVSSPIIPQDVWDDMTGEEWNDPKIVDQLARSGLELAATEDENEWIEWNVHKDTAKILKEKDMMLALDEDEVLVYVGNAKKEGYGSQLPIIKTKSILPLSADEMADLLMDSSRVKIYNKMSLGRKDIRTLGENTKIVQNLTRPPMAKNNMVGATLMHSKRLDEEDQALISSNNKDGYLVVSRAVPGAVDEEFADLTRNDILLGVNLLQDLGPNKCLMTAVTHVYSPVIPTMLARKLGVGSAINFIKDIRNVCEPVSN